MMPMSLPIRILFLIGAIMSGCGQSVAAQTPDGDAAGQCLSAPEPPSPCLDLLVDAAQAQFAGDPRISEEARFARGEAYSRKLLALSLAVHGEVHARTAVASNFLGLFLEKREPKEAEGYYRRAIAIAEAVGNIPDRVAIYHRNFGIFLMGKNRFAEAEPVFRAAMAISATTGNHDGQLRSVNQLGTVLNRLGRTDEAREVLLAGIAVAERERQRTLVSAELYQGVGDNFLSQSRYQDARTYFNMALGIVIDVAGESSRDAANVYTRLAEVAGNMGEDEELERLEARIYQIRLALLGPDHPAMAIARYNLAMTRWRMREDDKDAVRDLLAAQKEVDARYGADSETALSHALALAYPLHQAGMHDEELALRARSVAALEKLRARLSPRMISDWIEYALTLHQHGKAGEALTYFRRGNGALIERVRDSQRSPALLDEYGRKRAYFRWQVAAIWDAGSAEE
ncbi:MAG: hypothetical protein CVT77_06660 [Alphaproteobacteria bacterium HGW-Alphaproteobacteria-16]|nr:MAG: hypothetical protein CVT77_06660 [Alphaproteobacteria bacterium HGW-Alphaproteobacteria-16]